MATSRCILTAPFSPTAAGKPVDPSAARFPQRVHGRGRLCRGGMPVYTLGEAARASGKSKSTIAKAVKGGRVSAMRALDGSYQIDPAELHRVYPVTGATNGEGARSDTGAGDGALDRGVPGELDKWRALALEREETIRQLWRRLDAAEAERREVQHKLTALLTHRQVGSVPSVSSTFTSPRQPWWRRWFR